MLTNSFHIKYCHKPNASVERTISEMKGTHLDKSIGYQSGECGRVAIRIRHACNYVDVCKLFIYLAQEPECKKLSQRWWELKEL